MAEAAKDQDQSMEEILQSIKRIIAEEGEPAAPAGSDVLELTEMLADDGSVQAAKTEPVPTTMSIEEIMAAPISSMPQTEPTPAPEPMPSFTPPPVTPAAPAMADEGLISETTRAASAAALNALKDIPHAALPPLAPSGVGFRSGTTIEDLVLESLKPMLKDWLDSNLQGIVERLVEKEIRKLSAR